ncbi:MAG TPA: SCP2 sterol-binding domain-containing protein [Gaiellaceae bacterium]|jgi:putative sterol carrier protein
MAQPETAREFFEGLEQHVDPARTAGKHVSYRFDVRGVGSWRVVLDDGSLSVEESDADADCVVEADEKTFLGIVRRERSPIGAYLSGKVKVRGGASRLADLQDVLL